MAADEGHPSDPRRLVVRVRGGGARRRRGEHRQQPRVSPLLHAPRPDHRVGHALGPHHPRSPGDRDPAGRDPRHPARARHHRAGQPEAAARVLLGRARGAGSPVAGPDRAVRPLAASPHARRPAPCHRTEGPPGSRDSPAARLRAADSRRDRAGRRVGDHARHARTAAAAEAPGGHGLSLRALRQDRPAASLRRGRPRVPGRSSGAPAGDPRGHERRGRGPPARARARPLQPARVPGGRRAAPDPLAHHRQVGEPHGAGARGGRDRGHADRAHRHGRGGRGAPRAGAVGGGIARRPSAPQRHRRGAGRRRGSRAPRPWARSGAAHPDRAGALRPARPGRWRRRRLAPDGWLRETRISLDSE